MNIMQKYLDESDTQLMSITLNMRCRKCKHTWGVKMRNIDSIYTTPDWYFCIKCKDKERGNHEHERRGK